MVLVENTPLVHNLVVCTLCSCYPHDLLGDPPWWYRDDSYKERIVRDARGMLAERFNLRLPDHVEVRVHDSTSDVDGLRDVLDPHTRRIVWQYGHTDIASSRVGYLSKPDGMDFLPASPGRHAASVAATRSTAGSRAHTSTFMPNALPYPATTAPIRP